MVLLGFAWFLFTLDAANAPWLYTVGLVAGGLWGGVFLHLGLSFPTGRLADPARPRARDRGLLDLPAGVRARAAVREPGRARLPRLPGERAADPAATPTWPAFSPALGALLYFALFVVVLARARGSAGAPPSAFERLQITPVYVCSLGTFLLVTVARARRGRHRVAGRRSSPPALMPFAFLGGLLRSHVSHLDHELAERMEELRASRARLVEAGDAARRRLERDLHDGAQSRLVALALLLRTARGRVQEDDAARRRCSTRRRRSCARASPSCASSRAASTRRC